MQQSPPTRKPGVTPNDELLVFRWELAQRQPLDVGKEEERHAHHVPEVGVQVVDQFPVGSLAQPAEGGLDVEYELGEVLAAPLPFRPRRLALLLAFCNIE